MQKAKLEQLLKERILILDGGMGSMIQRYHLTEEDYRGMQFADLPKMLEGNVEALNITRPDVIQSIHTQYLESGADIIETNTLNATSISMSDYGMEAYVREINLSAVRVAKEVVDRYTLQNPDKPRFVAGSIGASSKAASLSPDVADPAFRNITFDELYVAYREQIAALIDGGVDALLIETSFDTLNVKASLMAAEEIMREKGKDIPLMISYTIAGKSGRILSGQTLEAALASVSHVKLLSIGLNCSFGAKDMKPFLKELKQIAPFYISAYPNAGLPNSFGKYDETPETMVAQVREFLDEGLVNIIGGCCGTTPDHISAIAKMVGERDWVSAPRIEEDTNSLILSGLDVLKIGNESCAAPTTFTVIGERCNVAGSRKFLRLIKEKKYEEALSIARKQVEDGARILDVNVDDGLLDGVHEMTTFLNWMTSDPDVAAVPVMIDSSDWQIIEAGLKCLQGKSIVNSISLKNGEEDFLKKARKMRSYGAAVVAMAFDEKGQADTFERKIEVCERMYFLLTEKAGFRPTDIIFDPNVLAIATGMEEHNNYAVDFIRAVEWIKQHLPGAKISGGISNLSFSFRGNDYLREAMHVVFLYYAIQKGLDMGIVNPSVSLTYEEIPKDLLTLIENVIFNRMPDAAEKLVDFAQKMENQQLKSETGKQEEWRTYPVAERLKQSLIKGISDFLEEDIREALTIYAQPVDIIDQPLMDGMNAVGALFGEGKMFLPQVVKTARTMKKAVSILQPFIDSNKKENDSKAGKILIATVKGDVHDIGKNITSVILSCNNYEVIDIGVMVPPEEIIQKAKDYQADMVALSGLITPSLQEMSFVASEMEKAGFSLPLIIGGATTSKLHTALKIDPLYKGAVVHVTDASQAVPVANKLLNPGTQKEYIEEIKNTYRSLREETKVGKELVSLDYARQHALKVDFAKYPTPRPYTDGSLVISAVPVETVAKYINWAAFMAAWKFPVKFAKITSADSFSSEEKEKATKAVELKQDALKLLALWQETQPEMIRAIIGFYPVKTADESLLIEGKKIPALRQQEKRDDDTYKSWIDFINPAGDYVGLFVATVGEPHIKTCSCGCASPEDDYQKILGQVLRDRLVEAASEYLHEQVRKDYWGYSPNESFGIRPASGYPIHPDLSLNFVINDLLDMNRVGVQLTANGAMHPASSVAGMYIAHPQADYFYLGAIDDEQLADYAAKKGISVEETKKWLGL